MSTKRYYQIGDNFPVVDIFQKGNWRHIALIRLYIYVYVRLCGLYFLDYLLRLELDGLLWVSRALKKFLTGRTHRPTIHYSFRDDGIFKLLWFYTALFVKSWPNASLVYAWWFIYACIAGPEHFCNFYSNAWSDNLPQSSSIHVFVDGNHFLAQVPSTSTTLNAADDAVTLEFIRMWYSEFRCRRGLGELCLPKTLKRIEKVKVSFAKNVWFSGDKIDTLDLGRAKNRQVRFFEDTWGVQGKSTITEELLQLDDLEQGLEFIRTWNITAISVIVVLPFALSLAFAAAWIGVYVARGTNVQVAVQTAFTVASYIVTAGALFIALIAFLDSQAPKET